MLTVNSFGSIFKSQARDATRTEDTMQIFETEQEATDHMNSTYPEYAATGVANVVKVGPQIAKHLGCKVGYGVKCGQ